MTLVKLRHIARAAVALCSTMRNICRSLVFTFGYNALDVTVAAGMLYPAFSLLLSRRLAGARAGVVRQIMRIS